MATAIGYGYLYAFPHPLSLSNRWRTLVIWLYMTVFVSEFYRLNAFARYTLNIL